MTEYEKKTGFVNLEELSKESDEILGNEGAGTPIVTFVTGIISGFVSPTGACSSKC